MFVPWTPSGTLSRFLKFSALDVESQVCCIDWGAAFAFDIIKVTRQLIRMV